MSTIIMMKNQSLVDRKWIKSAIKLFLWIMSGFLLMSAILFYSQYKSEFELIKSNQDESLSDLTSSFNAEIDDIASDILFLSKQNDLVDYLELPYQYYRDQIGLEYYHFALLKEKYSQLRYLDENGYELIRVNFKDGNAGIIPKDQLQDKADRYYFQETIKLNEGQIYISPLDLNIENGQIETPFNPMLRFGTPVFNNQGALKGAIILNYSGERLLSILKQNENRYVFDFYLINSEGYWLKGPDKNLEWGFMFPEGKDWTVADYSPEFSEKILLEPKGKYENRDGIYTYQSVVPYNEDSIVQAKTSKDGFLWHIISFLPRNQITEMIKTLVPGFVFVGGLITLSTAIISALISYNNALREQSKLALEHSASHDSLTNLPNRALFQDRLIHAIANGKRNENKLAVLFIDLDGFKLVNDTFGHPVGDQLLIQISNRLSETVRESDTVARFAGDEFVCLLENLKLEKDVQVIAEKLNTAISAEFTIEEFKIKISASIGISIFPKDSEDPDALLRYADEVMYSIKNKTKNDYAFYEGK